MCWFSEFSELMILPVCLAAAFDYAAKVSLDLVLGLALSLLLLIKVIEGIVNTRLTFVLVNELRAFESSS